MRIRSSLKSLEVDLLISLRNACSQALRVGLAEEESRAELKRLAIQIAPMITDMENEKI